MAPLKTTEVFEAHFDLAAPHGIDDGFLIFEVRRIMYLCLSYFLRHLNVQHVCPHIHVHRSRRDVLIDV